MGQAQDTRVKVKYLLPNLSNDYSQANEVLGILMDASLIPREGETVTIDNDVFTVREVDWQYGKTHSPYDLSLDRVMITLK